MLSRNQSFILISMTFFIGMSAHAFDSSVVATAVIPPRITVSKPTHTMIATRAIRTFNNLSCELAVLMSLDRQSVRIVRMDPPSGKINASYILRHPELKGADDVELFLANEFDLRGRNITSVGAQIALEDRQKDVVLTVQLDDGSEQIKNHSVIEEFLNDSPDHCNSLTRPAPSPAIEN